MGEPAAASSDDALKITRNATGEAEGPIARTTRHIALILLAVYVSLLAILLIAALYFASQSSLGETDQWFTLFKDGFLILGGALTTVIGYYFGSRGLQEAEAASNRLLLELNKAQESEKAALAEAETASRELRELREQQAPTEGEGDLEDPGAAPGPPTP